MSDVERAVIAAMRRSGLAGVGVAVIAKGRKPVFTCVGLADPRRGGPIVPETVFRIASISKTMTAIGVMQLRDRGLLDLDDPVNDHLMRLRIEPPAGGAAVTIRHLLTHTSGIGEFPRVLDLARKDIWGLGRPGTTANEPNAVYGGVIHAEVPAGSKWTYANHGFVVLGQLVEDVSGRPFAEYMRDEVFDPLQMGHTEYLRTERTAPQVATGSHWVLGRFRTVRDYDLTLLGAGSVLSSLQDMAAYASWLSRGTSSRTGRVLQADTLAEMMTSQFTIDRRLPAIGLAFTLNHVGTHRVAGHDGNIPGFASAMLVAPDDGVAVVVLSNTASLYGANLLAGALLRQLFDVPDPTAELPRADVPDQPHLWSELMGVYAPSPGFLTNFRAWQMLGGEVQVAVQKRHLTLRAPSPISSMRRGVTLHSVDADDPLRFAFTLDGLVVQVVFDRNDRGEVDRVVIGRPVSGTFHRRPNWQSSRLRVRALVALLALVAHGRLRRHSNPGSTASRN
jgi:CubicO group peptidase (beta-lactamase class C family)